MTTELAVFAASFAALYAGHHFGDYWVQTDTQAKHKGDAGQEGRLHCILHVITYLFTQFAMLAALALVTGMTFGLGGFSLLIALAVSGLTHYAADRREHGLMFWVARKLGKGTFMRLGVPRALTVASAETAEGEPFGIRVQSTPLDNPSLGTGAWALDQSWHLLFGVFVPALLLAAL